MSKGGSKGRLLAGLALVVGGGVLLLPRVVPIDRAPLWLLGCGVLAALYGIFVRSGGWIEAGMVTLGLGAGMALGDVTAAGIAKGEWLPLALGVALLGAWGLVRLTGSSRRWWTLVPAVMLLALAAVRIAGKVPWRVPPPVEEAIRTWWPAGLVVAGVFLVATALRRRG